MTADLGQVVKSDDEETRIKGLLTLYLRERLPHARNVAVTGVERVMAGVSNENWLFDASWDEAGQRHTVPMIARRQPEEGLLDSDPLTEFQVLQCLEPIADVPTPTARWIDSDGQSLGQPTLIMDRQPGHCDYLVLNNASLPLGARLELARELVDILARIHSMDWRSLQLDSVLTEPLDRPSLEAVDYWTSILVSRGVEPMPEMVVVERWLRKHAPDAERIAVVHGDFKPGNVLVDGTRITAVLDWETVHLGDPLEDLGWVTQPLRRREQEVTGAFEMAEIVARYEQATAKTVPENDLHWWRVLACFKAAVIQINGLSRFLNGKSRELYSAPLPLLRAMFELIGV